MTPQLEIYRTLQAENPTARIGGSIGLMLQGIDLKRDIANADIDCTCEAPFKTDKLFKTYEANDHRSDVSDFDFAFYVKAPAAIQGLKVQVQHKLDVKIHKTSDVVEIEHEGFLYRVIPSAEIIEYKRKYAAKLSFKHLADLLVINGCSRKFAEETINMVGDAIEALKAVRIETNPIDDLPF